MCLSNQRPLLSIVIATYNRAKLLDEALASLSVQTLQGGGPVEGLYEVLVIDNGSTDDTCQVAERRQRTTSNLRYIQEPRQGVNNARNRGIEEARAPYLIFFDDECTVATDFVACLCERLVNKKPILFGGPVFPRYAPDPPKPSWFRDSYGAFSVFERDVTLERLWLSGANLGGLREAFQSIGGFNPTLGPRGQRMVYGEEHELTERIQTQYGAAVVCYFSDIGVQHLVREEKYSVVNNLKEQCLRGYWRGRLSKASSVLNGKRDTSVTIVSTSSASSTGGLNYSKFRDLLSQLIRTPLFRDRQKYPYIQNYVIEVIGPFLRSICYGIGVLVGGVLRRYRRRNAAANPR